MLRLDPAHPPVWRTATSLQFGIDPVLRIDEPAPWQERLVKELERGIPDPGFRGLAAALGASAADADAFLRRLSPALEASTAARAPLATLRAADGFSPHATDRVVAALIGAGVDVVIDDPFDARPPVVHGTILLLAQHVVEPRRAAPLMADDAPHLPIVFTADRAEIGPLVIPGESACLSCLEADRGDADPAWPWILAQLVNRPPVEVRAALALEAGLLAAQLLSAVPVPAGRSVAVHGGLLRRRWHAHRRREDCGCRSLGGIARASVLDGRWLEPRTA